MNNDEVEIIDVKELETVDVKELIDEAAFWFLEGAEGREVDADYTEPYYWGLEEGEKKAIRYIDFHLAIHNRINDILKAINHYPKSIN